MRRAVAVIGMHRSGTSVIARSLNVFGVVLGDRLMPPAPSNEKGFFEDLDIFDIDSEILRRLGQDWHTLAGIERRLRSNEGFTDVMARAITVLRERFGSYDLFGVKAPRMARLLPFWKTVFARLSIDLSFVIVVRYPTNVAKSIEVRDGFSVEKTYYLWLQHVIPAVLETSGHRRVVVHYDLMLEDPGYELRRIASALDLGIDDAAQREFITEFLDDRLRHNRFGRGDLHQYAPLPQDVATAYELLEASACDSNSIESSRVMHVFEKLRRKQLALTPAFDYMTTLEHQLDKLRGDVEQLQSTLVQREEANTTLQSSIHDRETQIEELRSTLGDSEAANVALQSSIRNRETQFEDLNNAFTEILESRSWRLTMPARVLARSVRRICSLIL